MPDVPDLSDDIAQQAVEPVSETTDGQTTTGRSVSELIQADQYLAAKRAAANRRRGIRFTTLDTPGAAPGGGRCDAPFDHGGFC